MVDVMALQIISPYLHFEQRPCVFDYTFLEEVLYVTTGNPTSSLCDNWKPSFFPRLAIMVAEMLQKSKFLLYVLYLC